MKILKLLTLVVCTLFATTSIFAAWGDQYYWKSEATSGNWDQDWWNTAGGGYNQNPDNNGGGNLTFNNNNETTMNNDFDNASRWRITFESSADTARTISGSTENTFHDNSTVIPKIENNSEANHTINFPLKIGYSGGMEINPVDGDLTIGGDIDTNGNDINVWGDKSKMLTLSGIVSGSGNIIVQEYSKVKISGSSTFTGNVEIDEGEFWIGSGGSLGAGTIYVGHGSKKSNVAKLWLSDSNGGLTVSRNIVVNAGDADTRYIGGLNSSGVNTYSGIVTLNEDATIDANNSGGTISFSGTTIDLKDNTLTVDGSDNTTISAKLINSSGTGDIVKNGSGTLSIGNGENTFSGSVTVDAGTIAGIGKLSGSSTFKNSSVISPNGDSVGTFTFGNNLTFESGSEYNWEYGSSSSDLIDANGTLTLPSTANQIEVIISGDPPANTVKTLISTPNAISGNASAFYADNTGGNTVSFRKSDSDTDIEIVVAPEPGMVFGLILAGLMTLRAKGLKFKV